MLKKLTLLLLSLIAITPFAQAVTTVDGIRYEINSSSLTAYVTYYNNNNAESNRGYYYGDITIPETIEVSGKTYTVTGIGNYAFRYCSNLTSITLPETITSIGNDAFYDCSALTAIGDMPALSSIGYDAFYDCSALTAIGDLPALTSIGSYAFYGCTSLMDIYLPDTISELNSTAFPSQIFVHFAGNTPPAFSKTSIDYNIFVSEDAIPAYAAALAETKPNLILADNVPLSYDVTVSALDTDSDLRNKINDFRGRDDSYYVFDLKVHGTVNSYDIMVIRNKMLNLRTLDLSDASIVANPYEYYSGYRSEDNVIGDYMFYNLNTTKIILPPNIIKIGIYAFQYNKIEEITLPETVESLGYNAFQFCRNLKNIVIPPLVEEIPSSCFYECNKLSSVSLPPTLKTIGGSAFNFCYNLTEIRIPAGVERIESYAIPSSVRDVYTYTIQPTAIGQNTFGSNTYTLATLHVPETSDYLYYWDTKWSQFQNITNFNEPYTYFYLADADLIEDPDTPRIDGEQDEATGEVKNPDADFGNGSGLIVDGDNSQNLGNVDLENGASIIGGDSGTAASGGNINIDMLNLQINVEANKWYFFSFPFDVKCENIKFNGQMVWRYYDGEWRAMNGSGAWKDNKDEYLHRGKGYIFQASKKGTLTLSIPNASFNAQDWAMQLEQNISEMAQDASWNFVGNPFLSYYELADLGFDGPITWWNPNTKSYEAFNPADDDMSIYPFMAFFVQKPEGVDNVGFDSKYQLTNNQKNDKAAMKEARARRNARRAPSAAERLLVNLSISDENGSDRTRIVLNNLATAQYEVGVDASKFVSTAAPQIYSIDNADVRYAINELPDTDSAVRLGIYAPENGYYTIECTRVDCPMTIFDRNSNKRIDLTPGAKYQFIAEQGYDDTRFVICKTADVTAVDALDAEDNNAAYYFINGLKSEGSARGIVIKVTDNGAKKIIK